MPFLDEYTGKRLPWETVSQAQARVRGSVGRGPKAGTSPSAAVTAPAGSTVQTTSFTPSGTRPGLPKLPSFEVPQYDERRVSAIAQREAAPNVRRLRDVTARAIGQNFANPNVRRLTVREALQGFGSGLGNILAGAQRAAVSQYMPQFQASVAAAQATQQANVNAMMQEYNNLWTQFLQSGTQTTTTTRT